jgi:hypothetical protein
LIDRQQGLSFCTFFAELVGTIQLALCCLSSNLTTEDNSAFVYVPFDENIIRVRAHAQCYPVINSNTPVSPDDYSTNIQSCASLQALLSPS